jgi:hypothetical protein
VSSEQAAPQHTYEIQVEGHLDGLYTEWFGGMTVEHEGGGITALSGPAADQAVLHGLLAKVRDLGLPLVSVTQCTRRGIF